MTTDAEKNTVANWTMLKTYAKQGDCRHQVYRTFDGRPGGMHRRQCTRAVVETIHGVGFCKQHAAKMRKRLNVIHNA